MNSTKVFAIAVALAACAALARPAVADNPTPCKAYVIVSQAVGNPAQYFVGPTVARHFLPWSLPMVAWSAGFDSRQGPPAGAQGSSKLPPKAQLGWLRSQADRGNYAGICYFGPLLPVSLKAALNTPALWHVLPAQKFQLGLPAFQIEWQSYTQNQTLAAHGTGTKSEWYAVGRQHRYALMAKAAVFTGTIQSLNPVHIIGGSQPLYSVAGLHAKYDCGFGSAFCHAADGPALTWGMKYIAKLIGVQ